MTVCTYFLQGRCRYGDKCRNEHPRGGRGAGGGGGGGYNNYSRPPPQQQSRGGGGGVYGNRVWVNPSQKSGGNYIQPSSFSSHGGDGWGGGGDRGTARAGGRRDDTKSSEFTFSTQNRFSSLNSPSTFDRGRGGGGGDENDKNLETIQKDMEIWESSGQWTFSCYSVLKGTISGFTDLAPEELRLEYYNTRASGGDLQNYTNGVTQLLSQWRNRVQELKAMNASTRVAVLAELNNTGAPASSGGFWSRTGTGFGSSSSSFGSGGFGAPAPAQASSFSFAAPSNVFGSSVAPAASTGFGGMAAASTQPPSGFGSSSAASSAPSVANFSFTPAANKAPAASAFGSASGFSFSVTTNTGGGFGSNFGAGTAATAGSGSVFGQTSGGFGGTVAGAAAESGAARGTSASLFTPQSELTPEELNQFGAKRFTLGQVPLKPPPADMLAV
ncbi:nucleoporin NUP42 [Myripristis murdjan]|uniref:Nucleoporin NUP42 n=1 Tax=Myripristis murdjan TaxID=586833 RepID=A0A667WS44_9TELE|nr:nucleoporin-like protein 2 [Myripristis murdjan]